MEGVLLRIEKAPFAITPFNKGREGGGGGFFLDLHTEHVAVYNYSKINLKLFTSLPEKDEDCAKTSELLHMFYI